MPNKNETKPDDRLVYRLQKDEGINLSINLMCLLHAAESMKHGCRSKQCRAIGDMCVKRLRACLVSAHIRLGSSPAEIIVHRRRQNGLRISLSCAFHSRQRAAAVARV